MPLKDMLFSFKGRIRRLDWWLWGIGIGIVWGVALAAVGAALFNVSFMTSLLGGPELPQNWAFTTWSLVTFLPLMWVQSALAAKRAHDRNVGAAVAIGLTVFAGLLSFVPTGVDLIMGSAISDDHFESMNQGVNLVSGAASLYLLVVLGFLAGTRGPNRFGRSPKGIGGEPADKAADVFS